MLCSRVKKTVSVPAQPAENFHRSRRDHAWETAHDYVKAIAGHAVGKLGVNLGLIDGIPLGSDIIPLETSAKLLFASSGGL
jgi:hypothetical protein